MGTTLTDWEGRSIKGAQSSRSKVFAAYDWRELVLKPGPPIETKSRVPSARLYDFPPTEHSALTARDGHYSDVQSIRSEDTVTWSAFGAYASDDWIGELLGQSFGPANRPTAWARHYWKRLPHPDTGVTEHGPEADVTLEAEGGWFYAIEAKWLSDLPASQGQKGTVTQLEMRSGSVVHRSSIPDRRGVLLVVPGPARYPHATNATSTFRRYFAVSGSTYVPLATADVLSARAVTWEQIEEMMSTTASLATVATYLRWRLGFLPTE